MKFVDEVEIRVEAGDGGAGIVSFRREKYIPEGHPELCPDGAAIEAPAGETVLDIALKNGSVAKALQNTFPIFLINT